MATLPARLAIARTWALGKPLVSCRRGASSSTALKTAIQEAAATATVMLATCRP